MSRVKKKILNATKLIMKKKEMWTDWPRSMTFCYTGNVAILSKRGSEHTTWRTADCLTTDGLTTVERRRGRSVARLRVARRPSFHHHPLHHLLGKPTTIILLLCISRRVTSVRRPAAVVARALYRQPSNCFSEFRWTRFLFQKFFFFHTIPNDKKKNRQKTPYVYTFLFCKRNFKLLGRYVTVVGM